MTFETRTAKFVEWLTKHNVEISKKVEIQDLREAGQGRALVAKEDIAADEDLFKLPESIFLNAKNNTLIEDYPQVAEKLLDLTQWEALILVLAYEWLVKKEESKWAPYFDVLPINDSDNYKFDQLIFWSDDEINHLNPSYIVQRIGKDAADELLQKIEGLIETFEISELKGVSRDKLHLAAALIMSYSFDVQRQAEVEEDDEEEEEEHEDTSVRSSPYFKCMLPLADTLNANTNSHNASLMNHENSLIMKSIKAISKGEQIYNTYSEHPNAEILRRYGYVEPEGSVADFGEVSLDLIKQHFENTNSLSNSALENILNSLRELQDEEGEEFILENYDCFKSGEVIFEFIFLVQVLAILAQANEEVNFTKGSSKEINATVRRTFKKCYQLLESGKLTDSVKDHMKRIILARLAEYDGDAISGFEVKLPMTRECMARVVLLSEHEALSKCAEGDRLFSSSERDFAFIPDAKLLRNLLKNHDNGPEKKKHKASTE